MSTDAAAGLNRCCTFALHPVQHMKVRPFKACRGRVIGLHPFGKHYLTK